MLILLFKYSVSFRNTIHISPHHIKEGFLCVSHGNGLSNAPCHVEQAEGFQKDKLLAQNHP